MSYGLPNGWAVAPLGELGEWGSGGTPQRSRQEYFEPGTISWLKIGDLNDGLVSFSEEAIASAGLANSAAKLLPKGALLVAMYGSIGKLGVTAIECATNQAIAYCLPKIDPWYLFWALRLNREALNACGKGGTQANISQTVLRAFEIPIAPLSEQRRIVANAESLLTQISAVRERLAHVPLLLNRFRQAVLQAAFSGQLGDLPPHEATNSFEWRRACLKDVGQWVSGGTPSRRKLSYFGGDIPWVKSGELRDQVVIGTEETISREALEHSSAKVLPQGTVSIAMYGATIGRLGILGIAAATNQACSNCIVDEEKMDRWFLFYFLLSQRASFITAGQGGAQPNISQAILREWPIAYPSLPEQREIVRRVETLLPSRRGSSGASTPLSRGRRSSRRPSSPRPSLGNSCPPKPTWRAPRAGTTSRLLFSSSASARKKRKARA